MIFRQPPRRDDFQIRRERRIGQLKPALVISLTGGTVSNGVSFFFLRNLNLRFRNQRPSNASTEVILIFVNRTSLNHRENKISRKLLDQIHLVKLARPSGLRFRIVNIKICMLR